jgi:hypothetical protein
MESTQMYESVICNYAPDDELDDNGNPSFTNGNIYNITMRNLFTTMQTMMTRAGFLPDVAMLILLATVVVMDMCMLMGPASGWSETKEYCFLSQFQLPFAKNIIAYVLSKCENLVGVMVFGQKAYDNILPWLHMKFSHTILIQNVFLSHPQNIQWRYTLEHARNYIETFRGIMNLLGVDTPPLEGVVKLRSFLMTKKRKLEMMECVEEFVDSEVLEAVHQRTDKVKIARMAIVEEMLEMEVLKEMKAAAAAAVARRKEIMEAAAAAAKRKEIMEAAAEVARRKEMQEAAAAARRKEMQEAAVAAAVKRKTFLELDGSKTYAARRKEMQEAVAAAARRKEMQEAAAAAVKRKTFLELAGSKTYCVRLCSHVGCVTSVHARGVCRDHGPGCSHEGCERNVQARGVCKGHDHEPAP